MINSYLTISFLLCASLTASVASDGQDNKDLPKQNFKRINFNGLKNEGSQIPSKPILINGDHKKSDGLNGGSLGSDETFPIIYQLNGTKTDKSDNSEALNRLFKLIDDCELISPRGDKILAKISTPRRKGSLAQIPETDIITLKDISKLKFEISKEDAKKNPQEVIKKNNLFLRTSKGESTMEAENEMACAINFLGKKYDALTEISQSDTERKKFQTSLVPLYKNLQNLKEQLKNNEISKDEFFNSYTVSIQKIRDEADTVQGRIDEIEKKKEKEKSELKLKKNKKKMEKRKSKEEKNVKKEMETKEKQTSQNHLMLEQKIGKSGEIKKDESKKNGGVDFD